MPAARGRGPRSLCQGASTTRGSGSQACATSSGACKPHGIEGGAGAGDASTDPVDAPKPGGVPTTQGASSGTCDAPASCRPPHADSGGDSRASTALTTQGAGITMGRPGSAGSHGSTGDGADARRAAPVPPTPCPDRGQETAPVRLRRTPVLAPNGTWHLGTWQLAAVMGREARLPPLPGYDRSAPFGTSDLASIMREIQPARCRTLTLALTAARASGGATWPPSCARSSPPRCQALTLALSPAAPRTRACAPRGASMELATLPAPKPLPGISERPAAAPALRLRLALPALKGLGAASGQPKEAPESNFDLPGAPQLARMQFGIVHHHLPIYLADGTSSLSLELNMQRTVAHSHLSNSPAWCRRRNQQTCWQAWHLPGARRRKARGGAGAARRVPPVCAVLRRRRRGRAAVGHTA